MSKTKLSDIGKIITGNTPKTSDSKNYDSNDIPFVKPSDIFDDEITSIDSTEYWISECARDKARVLPKNSILVTCIGIIGKVGINTVECAFNQQINAIVPDKEKCIPKYISYAILHKQQQLQDIANAPVVPIINKTQFSNIEVEIPSVETQTEVVSRLDRVSQLIYLQKQALEKLDELIKSRFVEMVGDTETNSNNHPVYKLSELCTVSSSKRIYQEEQSNSGIPFLRISNLVELIDNDEFESKLFITEEKYCELLENNLVPKAGDILVTSRGTLGKCYIIKEDDKFYFQDGMISWLYNLNKCVTSIYLAFLFDTRYIKQQIEKMQSGSTVAYLSIAMLKKIKILVPPVELQNQFADLVEHIKKQKTAVQKSIEKLEILKKSLMQEYFG